MFIIPLYLKICCFEFFIEKTIEIWKSLVTDDKLFLKRKTHLQVLYFKSCISKKERIDGIFAN